VFGPKLRMKNNISKKMANLEEDQSEVEELWDKEDQSEVEELWDKVW
jgi:hypothetical protein